MCFRNNCTCCDFTFFSTIDSNNFITGFSFRYLKKTCTTSDRLRTFNSDSRRTVEEQLDIEEKNENNTWATKSQLSFIYCHRNSKICHHKYDLL